MTKLESFIRKHYNLTLQDESNMPQIVARVQELIDSGEYDDDLGRGISEYVIYDLVDEALCELAG